MVKFMESYLSLEEMRDMALGVNRNLEPVLKLAFAADVAKEQTAKKRLQGTITERNISVLKVIETEYGGFDCSGWNSRSCGAKESNRGRQ
jgi:hypothetical protein